jgi:hypothetical protein
LATPVVIVIIIIVVVPATHPLVVILTVSHVPPSVTSLEVSPLGNCLVASSSLPPPTRPARRAQAPLISISVSSIVAFSKDAFLGRRAGTSHQHGQII